MRTVQEIYDAYKIMPSLQLHQLRVAAVAQMLCEDLTRDVDRESVVLACLFHDMGNIIKSNLHVLPDLLEPEGAAHWQLVKDEFIREYGDNEHRATEIIAQKIGLPAPVRVLISGIGFPKLGTVRDSRKLEEKIVEYADLRAGPHGVLSMSARIQEARERYASKRSDIPRNEESFRELEAAAYAVEQQLFAEATIAPSDITEHSIAGYIERFRDYTVA
jgi:5'-deoxynucleotidase YfbR-like HD superfamily hydrolase